MGVLRCAVLSSLLLVPLWGQESQPSSSKSRPVVAIVGASVSAGFSCTLMGIGEPKKNQTMTLKRALGAVWSPDAVLVRDFSDLTTFTDPIGISTKKVELAKAAEPALVVAVDFLFWFGYGYIRGGNGDEAKARLALLQEGLGLLDQFRCPIVVGDFPDMTGADPRMLSARQIPSLEIQAELNLAVGKWAKGKPNVRLFQLAEYVKRSKTEGETVESAGKPRKLEPEVLLQDDHLHATKLGVLVLALRLLPEIRAAVPEKSQLVPGGVTFEEMAAALRVK